MNSEQFEIHKKEPHEKVLFKGPSQTPDGLRHKSSVLQSANTVAQMLTRTRKHFRETKEMT